MQEQTDNVTEQTDNVTEQTDNMTEQMDNVTECKTRWVITILGLTIVTLSE